MIKNVYHYTYSMLYVICPRHIHHGPAVVLPFPLLLHVPKVQRHLSKGPVSPIFNRNFSIKTLPQCGTKSHGNALKWTVRLCMSCVGNPRV